MSGQGPQFWDHKACLAGPAGGWGGHRAGKGGFRGCLYQLESGVPTAHTWGI